MSAGAIYEKQRPGAAEVLDDSQKQRLIAMVCSSPPEGRARWTVRLVAEEAVKRKLVPRAGRETIRILLLSHDLKPWRKKMWVVADLDDDYIDKMEDILKLYERPNDPQQPVVCLDEKPVTLHADLRPDSPAKPGREARRDNEYKRNETANVFCAVEPKAGHHFTFATPDRSGFEFAKVAAEIALQRMRATTIHLLLDNLNIHRLNSLTDLYGVQFGSQIWTDSRFTTRLRTGVGLIRRRMKSVYSRGNAWGAGESRISRLYADRREPGIGAPTALASRFNGGLTGKPHVRNLDIKNNSFKRSQT